MGLDRLAQYGVDTTGRGTQGLSSLTVPRMSADYNTSFVSEADEGDPEAHPATGGNPLTFVFLLLGLIIALFFLRKASPVLAAESFGINWLTFAQVTTMSAFGILLLKAFFGRFNVPGITNAVSAI